VFIERGEKIRASSRTIVHVDAETKNTLPRSSTFLDAERIKELYEDFLRAE
jgi:hypothetical protein